MLQGFFLSSVVLLNSKITLDDTDPQQHNNKHVPSGPKKVITPSILFICNHLLFKSALKEVWKLYKVSKKSINCSSWQASKHEFHEGFYDCVAGLLNISSVRWWHPDVPDLGSLLPHFLPQISQLSMCLSNLKILERYQCFSLVAV